MDRGDRACVWFGEARRCGALRRPQPGRRALAIGGGFAGVALGIGAPSADSGGGQGLSSRFSCQVHLFSRRKCGVKGKILSVTELI